MSSSSTSTLDIGAIIWVSINPIIQLILVGAVGNFLARSGILTPQGSKLMSKVYVQALIPSLLFARMLDSVTPQAAKRMIIVIPFVVLYMVLGLLAGFICRKVFSKRLPASFNYTLLVASTWSNWGDIPLAVIDNFTSSPPFIDGDGPLGVAYVSVFLIIFNVTLFPLGGHKLVEKDFKKTEPETVNQDIELQESFAGVETRASNEQQRFKQLPLANKLSEKLKPSRFQYHKMRFTRFFISLLTPVNISIAAGLVLGLTPAKDLFIKSENNPYLVSGLNPPLYIIYTTAKFLGAACVPIGLLNLGAALVGLDFKAVPLTLSFFMAFFKLILTPLIGIPLVYWCSHGLNLIDKDERSLQLVLMFGSCVPSATTTLVLTQYYNPTGEAKHVTSLLVFQYVLGLFTMTLTLGVISFLLS